MDPATEQNSCAYVLVEIDIKDPVAYEEYKKLAPASIKQYGGRYVVRGGLVTVLEGEWNPPRIVILQFPSIEKAQQWWESPEYEAAKAMRLASAQAKMIILGGII